MRTKTTLAKKVLEKKATPKEPEVKKQSVFVLQLTKMELVHLRDIMGVLLPPDGSETISQALASSEDRSLVESMLWDKLTHLCEDANLPVGDEAPDYIVVPTAPPPMGVLQVQHDTEDSSGDAKGFLPANEDEDEDQEEEED